MSKIDPLYDLFIGPLSSRYDHLKSKRDITLVHYTSAFVLLEVLEKRYIWMRNARCMNDTSEVDYAFSCIRHYFSDHERQKRFRDQCNGCHPGVFDEVDQLLTGHLESFALHTYMTCLSEHHREEDANGRLSMWRGYGGDGVPVAVVLRKEAMMDDGPYGLSGYPVQYMTPEEVVVLLDQKVRLMADDRLQIVKATPESFRNALWGMFQTLIATLKHPGFKEEKEWRIVYQPNLLRSDGLETHRLVKAHHGVPQAIYRIPLNGKPINKGIAVTPDQILEKVIIGPCSEARVVLHALSEALAKAGIEKAQEMVSFCGIPYREKL